MRLLTMKTPLEACAAATLPIYTFKRVSKLFIRNNNYITDREIKLVEVRPTAVRNGIFLKQKAYIKKL